MRCGGNESRFCDYLLIKQKTPASDNYQGNHAGDVATYTVWLSIVFGSFEDQKARAMPTNLGNLCLGQRAVMVMWHVSSCKCPLQNSAFWPHPGGPSPVLE